MYLKLKDSAIENIIKHLSNEVAAKSDKESSIGFVLS